MEINIIEHRDFDSILILSNYFSRSANKLAALSLSLYFHKINGIGQPITRAISANKLFPHP